MARLLISLFTLICFQLSAQQTILKGVVLDKKDQKPIASSSVNIKSEDGKIVSFKTTNKEGRFQLTINRSLEGLTLEINHLGYKRFSKKLENANDLKIELETSSVLLEDVEVKSRPAMRRIGDTLSYNVEAFAQDEDRSIGDVIKRLPGMEVSESGQIKYQGKAISNFYIDGDDLLEDKYAIGNRTIPHGMVKDVQVMENHEHQKVMKGKRFSDDVAVNLVIKDDAKLELTGQAKLGAGFPHQYDAEVNTMLFNKKVKTLNALSGNNVGRDFTGEMIGFGQSNMLGKMETSTINNMLSLGTVGAPPISSAHYYINNSAYLNSNYLINRKKDWQFKSNLQALYDQNSRDFAGVTSYFTEAENINFDEKQHSEIKQFLSSLRLTASKNVDNKFVNNNFTFDFANEKGAANIRSNQDYFDIKRNHQIIGFSNRLEYVPELKNKNIIQFNWFLSYGNKPQELIMNPGIYPNLLHTSIPYDQTNQHISVPEFFTNVNSGYRFTKGLIKQYYGVGFSLENQQLNSHIDVVKGGVSTASTADSSVNNMDWLRARSSFQANYDWKAKRFQASLRIPLVYQNTRFADENYNLDERKNQLLLNPTFNATYRVNREDEINASYQYGNSFGNIENVYRGMIIRNYRSISNNNSDLFETSSQNVSAGYKLSRTLKLLTANWSASYRVQNMNTITSQIQTSDISQTILIPLDNKVSSFSASAGIDKYIFAWASSAKLGLSWSLSDYNQLFNQDLLPFQNQSFSVSPSIEAKIWKDLKISYAATGTWSASEQKGNLQQLNQNVFQGSQNIGFPITVYKKVHVRFSARHLYTKQPGMEEINYVFFDTFARYRLKKIDFELNLTNLANIKKFETYNISSNMMRHNEYQLRGRMGVFKMVFAL